MKIDKCFNNRYKVRTPIKAIVDAPLKGIVSDKKYRQALEVLEQEYGITPYVPQKPRVNFIFNGYISRCLENLKKG